MKRTVVLKKIAKAAKSAGVEFAATELTNHTGLTISDVRTTIGRHSKISEGTAEALYRQLQPALGKGWWRR
jgi:hypothetical protein